MNVSSDSSSIHDPLSETRSLISLLKANNVDLQHNALKGLMFCPTVCVVNAFLDEGNLRFLVSLCVASHKRVESAALRLLWHLSAQAELKVRLYEEGIMDRIKVLMCSEDSEVQLACSAILQNITEYRFDKGGINPNQVKIVNEGILDLLSSRVTAPDRRIQFLTCLTICNLSMNEENSRKILRSQLLDKVRQFVEVNQLHVDMVCHWITLQPHVPLLNSKYPQVQLFALSCLLTLIRNEQYKVEVWKALSINEGVNALFFLMKSEDPAIAQLATIITNMLQVEEPAILVEQPDIGQDLRKMWNNNEFSDVRFVCKDGVVYAHRAILASRCPQFHAMFTHFRESHQHDIHLPEMEYSTFCSILEYIYTGTTTINRKNVIDVLVAAEMYSLRGLKQNCEFFLWHYIDIDNVVTLYQTSSLHQATQLRKMCMDFIVRNFDKISQKDDYGGLPKEVKDEVMRAVKSIQYMKSDSEAESRPSDGYFLSGGEAFA